MDVDNKNWSFMWCGSDLMGVDDFGWEFVTPIMSWHWIVKTCASCGCFSLANRPAVLCCALALALCILECLMAGVVYTRECVCWRKKCVFD